MSPRATVSAIGATALLLLAPGCGRGDAVDDAERGPAGVEEASPAARRATSPRVAFPPARDACELIPADEVAALVGGPIQSRREPLERPHEAVCAYGPPGGWSVLYVTAYWSGGKEEWEARQAARSAGETVGGIGDAAHYGGILPSLVLSGDVLLEFAMLLPDERASFPRLAQQAMSRL